MYERVITLNDVAVRLVQRFHPEKSVELLTEPEIAGLAGWARTKGMPTLAKYIERWLPSNKTRW